MKEQLTLQELAAYLPWEVKGNLINQLYFDDQINKELFRIETGKSVSSDPYDITVIVGDCESGIEDFKPYLYPLSHLTKEIEHKGEKFVPIERLFNIAYKTIYDHDFDGIFSSNNALKENLGIKAIEDDYQYGFTVELPYHFRMSANGDFLTIPQFELYQKLAEWHIDFQNLIPRGLAVNKLEI